MMFSPLSTRFIPTTIAAPLACVTTLLQTRSACASTDAFLQAGGTGLAIAATALVAGGIWKAYSHFKSRSSAEATPMSTFEASRDRVMERFPELERARDRQEIISFGKTFETIAKNFGKTSGNGKKEVDAYALSTWMYILADHRRASERAFDLWGKRFYGLNPHDRAARSLLAESDLPAFDLGHLHECCGDIYDHHQPLQEKLHLGIILFHYEIAWEQYEKLSDDRVKLGTIQQLCEKMGDVNRSVKSNALLTSHDEAAVN